MPSNVRAATIVLLAFLFPGACAHVPCEPSTAVALIQVQHDSGGEFPIMQQLVVHQDGSIRATVGGKAFCRRVNSNDRRFAQLVGLLQEDRTLAAMAAMARRNAAQQPSGEFFGITTYDIFVFARPAALEPPVNEIVKLADSIAKDVFGGRWLSFGESVQ